MPVPASGTEMTATVAASFTCTSIGSSIWPVARAWRRKSANAASNSGEATLSASTATTAGSGPPGKDAWIRS